MLWLSTEKMLNPEGFVSTLTQHEMLVTYNLRCKYSLCSIMELEHYEFMVAKFCVCWIWGARDYIDLFWIFNFYLCCGAAWEGSNQHCLKAPGIQRTTQLMLGIQVKTLGTFRCFLRYESSVPILVLPAWSDQSQLRFIFQLNVGSNTRGSKTLAFYHAHSSGHCILKHKCSNGWLCLWSFFRVYIIYINEWA